MRKLIGVPVVILVLVCFAAYGVDLIIRPRRHMNAYLRRGGDMLREWNELQLQFAGLVFAGVSVWMLSHLLRSI